MKAPLEHLKIHTVNQRLVPFSAGQNSPSCSVALPLLHSSRGTGYDYTPGSSYTPRSSLLPCFLVFPHLHDSPVREGRMALRGQSRFWSYEKGSKAMGLFTAAGVTRSPVILQDYFSLSCEMAGRWILVGCGLFLRDGVCLGEGSKWARTNTDTTRTTSASRQFRPQDRTQNLPCIYQRKKKINTRGKQHFI